MCRLIDSFTDQYAGGNPRQATRTIAVLCAAALLPGCGTKLPTVEGTVTLDGEPLPKARVVFEAPDRPMAVATTDESGHYDVMTGSQRGMATGSYNVAISAYATTAGGSESPIPVLKTPRRYNSARTSDLTAKIKDEANENVDFELQSASAVP